VSHVGILGAGAAAGSLRLPAAAVHAAWGRSGGRGAAAICASDEDTLTLAWEAATAALHAAGVDPDLVGHLAWGTTRPPFAEGPSHAYLATALSLRSDVEGALAAGSTHAGAEALVAAWDAVASGAAPVALVVASDALLPGLGTGFEPRCGSGAAALVLGASGASGASGDTADTGDTAGGATLVRRVTRSHPVVDRYRGDGEPGTREAYDARLFREEVFLPAVAGVGDALVVGDATRWSLPDPDGRLGAAAARRLGATDPPSAAVYTAVGDSGAAAALLGLLPTLATPGPAAMVAYGGGRATGVVVDVAAPVAGAAATLDALAGGREVTYPEALRARGQLEATGERVEMGLPPGGAAFVRGNPEMLGLLGGRCVDCGTISTPPSIHPACVGCGGAKLEPVALARAGTVQTYVVNHTMPAPFEAPLGLAVLDLDDGARLMLQATEPEGLEIGASVDLVLRRYAVERGIPVYGFKARVRRA
jgi:hydroxymethylglutaryl-CoA synthase